MQSEKAAYERIILEKDRQLSLLKDIIKKLEDSRSKDLVFLKEEAFKIKDSQIEVLESEKNAEKLAFLGIIEQCKSQIKAFETNLENKIEENKKLSVWNVEKTKEIEVLKENKRELQIVIDDWKNLKEEKDLSEAIIRASKEKTMMEAQIRNLRNTIENQKTQIDKLFEKLQEKGLEEIKE